jgi:hypothetical protein
MIGSNTKKHLKNCFRKFCPLSKSSTKNGSKVVSRDKHNRRSHNTIEIETVLTMFLQIERQIITDPGGLEIYGCQGSGQSE